MGLRNKFTVNGDIVTLILRRRNKSPLKTKLNLEDFKNIKKWNTRWYSRWSESANTYYVQGDLCTGRKIQLHRAIMNLTEISFLEKVVDHLDYNGLNNLRNNLEISSKRRNHLHQKGLNPNNTTGFRGVTYDKNKHLFIAQIQLNGKCVYLGCAKTAKDAASIAKEARDRLGIREFAKVGS